MRILAVDSAAETGTVCIAENSKIAAVYSIEAKTHSATLLPMIVSMLENLHYSIADIDLLAVTNGPGSFTGIRIGVAAVKGLAFRDSIPCVGVSSLEAMAYNFLGIDGIICPVINARRNQVYSALFKSHNGNVERLTDDDIILIDNLKEKLSIYVASEPDKNIPVYFSGDAAETVCESMNSAEVNNKLPPKLLCYPNAYGVALAAEKIYLSSNDTAAFTEAKLIPHYLRKPQAERELEERIKANSSD